MQIYLTDSARQFLTAAGERELTVSSLVFSSCCSGPLPPEVKPGAPADPEGYAAFAAGDLTLYYDSLLDPRPELHIDAKDYGLYAELIVQGWE